MPPVTLNPSPVRTPTPAAPAASPDGVTVRRGDTLAGIAARLGVSTDALVRANLDRYPGLASNRDQISVGWTLKAPGAAPAQAGWSAGSPRTANAAAPQQVSRPLDFGHALAAGGARSLELRMKAHHDAIEKTGVGVYYGDHSLFKSLDPQRRQEWVKENAKPGTTPPARQKESSCIGWAMENVGAAYAAAGKTARWNEIMSIVTAKGSKGIDLAKELKKDGWQSIYWNPDAKHPNDGLAEHSFSASQVARGKPYYGVDVDAQVINYRPTDPSKTKRDLSGMAKLDKVPFFFGLAKGGMHTFVGRQGKVNEFHWDQMPNSAHAIQETPLKDWGWNSGLIMVPPGTWPASQK